MSQSGGNTAESVHILVSRIERIEKELEALKLGLLKLRPKKMRLKSFQNRSIRN